MIRKIIHIDEEKCNGCGACAPPCHEGAIDIINGKAKLVRENFCDGFGDCLPGCPTGAITFEEREAPAYDEAAVQENKKKKELQEKIVTAVKDYAASPQWKKDNGQYIPHPATFLNQRRWEDEVPCASSWDNPVYEKLCLPKKLF